MREEQTAVRKVLATVHPHATVRCGAVRCKATCAVQVRDAVVVVCSVVGVVGVVRMCVESHPQDRSRTWVIEHLVPG
jgi:hypothetical protein